MFKRLLASRFKFKLDLPKIKIWAFSIILILGIVALGVFIFSRLGWVPPEHQLYTIQTLSVNGNEYWILVDDSSAGRTWYFTNRYSNHVYNITGLGKVCRGVAGNQDPDHAIVDLDACYR